MHPKDFYTTHLLPAYEAWSKSGHQEWLFKAAAVNVAQMGDHVFKHFGADGQLSHIGNPNDAGHYRQRLRAECAEFGLIWDVADGHKHVHVTRPTEVSSDAQTKVRHAGGAYSAGFSSGFDKTGEKVMIDKDDGTTVPGAPVLKRALLMWAEKLRGWGML